MIVKDLVIKLNTGYSIEDIDEVEANGTSAAEAFSIAQDMCCDDINEQVEEVIKGELAKYNCNIIRCDLYLDEISELHIDAEIDEKRYDHVEEAKEAFIIHVTKAATSECFSAYHSFFVLDDDTTIWIEFEAIESDE